MQDQHYSFAGFGDFDSCVVACRNMFGSFRGTQYPVRGDFVGISGFYYISDTLNIAGHVTDAVLSSQGRRLCGIDADQLSNVYGDRPFLSLSCFDAAYVYTVLFDGFSLNAPHADATSATGKSWSSVRAEDTSWALGALVYEVDKLEGSCEGCYSWFSVLLPLLIVAALATFCLLSLQRQERVIEQPRMRFQSESAEEDEAILGENQDIKFR